VRAISAPPLKKSCVYQKGIFIPSKIHSGDDIHCRESPIRTTTAKELYISKRILYFLFKNTQL